MASNSFGTLFRITTWGESHGKGVGVVIDGCPAGIPLTEEDLAKELARRAGGKTPYVTARSEKDVAEILSGVFEGKTTGAPISIILWNQDTRPSSYEPIKEILRPGHATFTYLEKYGIFDYRGGGRASARETASRVAAGAVAKKLLSFSGIAIYAYLYALGGTTIQHIDLDALPSSPIFCPDPHIAPHFMETLLRLKEEGDSVGGVVECVITGLQVGLGDPVYEKLEAGLAKGMLTIPATKGFEIGEGFRAATFKGSEHNDPFTLDPLGKVMLETNHAGGTLGGISTGEPVTFRVPFKPTASIAKPQPTVDRSGKKCLLHLPSTSRHDPCVAIRAVPVVEAMAALTIADSLLLSLHARWDRRIGGEEPK